MALAVGVTPAQLAEAGRADAAGILAEMMSGSAFAPDTQDPLIVKIWASPNLTDDQKLALERIVRRALADIEMATDRLRRDG